MAAVEAVISDFGGVLTSPLQSSFQAFQEASGITVADLGQALVVLATARGANPLFELETGRLSEPEFLGALGEQLTTQLHRPVELAEFGETYFAGLEPNARFIAYMRELRGRGYKLAICTNNVHEWAHRWRAMLPVDEIFDVVVDSSQVGSRKPEARIYEITLEQVGVDPERALLIDDVEINCDAARALGMRAVWFQSTEQALTDTEAALAAAA